MGRVSWLGLLSFCQREGRRFESGRRLQNLREIKRLRGAKSAADRRRTILASRNIRQPLSRGFAGVECPDCELPSEVISCFGPAVRLCSWPWPLGPLPRLKTPSYQDAIALRSEF